MGPDNDHQYNDQTTMRPTHVGEKENKGYLFLTFRVKKKKGKRKGNVYYVSKLRKVFFCETEWKKKVHNTNLTQGWPRKNNLIRGELCWVKTRFELKSSLSGLWGPSGPPEAEMSSWLLRMILAKKIKVSSFFSIVRRQNFVHGNGIISSSNFQVLSGVIWIIQKTWCSTQ